jgi:hypothetical protein
LQFLSVVVGYGLWGKILGGWSNTISPQAYAKDCSSPHWRESLQPRSHIESAFLQVAMQRRSLVFCHQRNPVSLSTLLRKWKIPYSMQLLAEGHGLEAKMHAQTRLLKLGNHLQKTFQVKEWGSETNMKQCRVHEGICHDGRKLVEILTDRHKLSQLWTVEKSNMSRHIVISALTTLG